MLAEHDVVTVQRDLLDRGLRAGDVGAVVHCYTGKDAYEVEFFDENGRPRGVETLEGYELLRLNLTSLVGA
jgi:hypothetical protein